MIHFVMNNIPQYDDKMIKEKGKDKNIITWVKWNGCASVTILKLLRENDCVPLLHMIRKNIIYFDTDKMVTQFIVGYISMPQKAIHSENKVIFFQ